MQYGIALATTTESWRIAKRAEQLGFDYVWFYDTQLLNPDVFVAMTQAAMHTERIQLATGVLIPSNRIEPVTANAFASLNQIAPGRIHFGVGTGYTGRRTMDLRAIPLAQMRRYVRRVQSLLRGERANVRLEGESRRIGFLDPELGLINTTDPVPVHTSALGPKARRVAAELEGGWINFGADEAGALKTLTDMQNAWTEADHEPESLYSTLFALGCILEPGEGFDSDRAMAQAGPYVSVFFHNLVETSEPGSMESVLGKVLSDQLESYREVYLSYPEGERHLYNHRGHLMYVREDERFLVTPELIESLTFTGDAASLSARLAALEAAGYSQFCIQLVEGQLDAIEGWASLFSLSG
ncbi:MAG: LLM class flavin-dependent oxidoreductase [Pseudomonadota bacterium]